MRLKDWPLSNFESLNNRCQWEEITTTPTIKSVLNFSNKNLGKKSKVALWLKIAWTCLFVWLLCSWLSVRRNDFLFKWRLYQTYLVLSIILAMSQIHAKKYLALHICNMSYRTLTEGGRITVQLVSSLTRLDSTSSITYFLLWTNPINVSHTIILFTLVSDLCRSWLE